MKKGVRQHDNKPWTGPAVMGTLERTGDGQEGLRNMQEGEGSSEMGGASHHRVVGTAGMGASRRTRHRHTTEQLTYDF